MSKKKRIILLAGLLAMIAVTVLAVIMLLPPKVDKVQVNLMSDNPTLAYKALHRIVGGSASYNLKICEIGSAPKIVATDAKFFGLGGNGSLLAVAKKDQSILDYYIYLMGSSGEWMLVTDNGSYFEIANAQDAMYYTDENYPYSLFVLELTSDGEMTDKKELTVAGSVFQEYNFNAGIATFMKNFRSDQEGAFDDEENNPYDYNWGDIYLCTADGETQKIAEKAFCSGMEQSVSDDGTVVYISDCHEETETGDLYMKALNGEPRLIKKNTTNGFAISSDGQLIAAIVKDEDQKNTLYYQFQGQDAREIRDVIYFKISQDSSTLVYLANTEEEKRKALYWVTKDSEPVLITENAIGLQEVSRDGKTVAYLANYDDNSRTGDLYVVRAGEDPELIDSGAYVSTATAFWGMTTINMRDDGQYIAYLKNINTDRFYGDLYVAEIGGETQMVDRNVSTGFEFFGHE